MIYPDAGERIRIDRAVSYDGRSSHCLADVYYPPGPTVRRGAVLVIHGGGFWKGRRDEWLPSEIATTLAEAGLVAFSVDYALAPNARETKAAFPGNVHDCKNALRWVRANAASYSVDPERIGAIGHSAGGWLALALGLTAGDPHFDPPGLTCPAVQAVVSLYSPTDGEWSANHYGYADQEDMPWARRHSPVNWVTPDAPPVLTLHGTDDTVALPEHARLLDAAFKRAGREHALVWVKGAGHTFPLSSDKHDVRPEVIGFFRKHLGGAE